MTIIIKIIIILLSTIKETWYNDDCNVGCFHHQGDKCSKKSLKHLLVSARGDSRRRCFSYSLPWEPVISQWTCSNTPLILLRYVLNEVCRMIAIRVTACLECWEFSFFNSVHEGQFVLCGISCSSRGRLLSQSSIANVSLFIIACSL